MFIILICTIYKLTKSFVICLYLLKLGRKKWSLKWHGLSVIIIKLVYSKLSLISMVFLQYPKNTTFLPGFVTWGERENTINTERLIYFPNLSLNDWTALVQCHENISVIRLNNLVCYISGVCVR